MKVIRHNRYVYLYIVRLYISYFERFFMAKKSSLQKVLIIPLGGVDGIGMNMTVFEYEDSLIAVDCGVAFPEDDMLGVDLVIPDFSYIEQNSHKLLGLFVTHGHEDHIGAIPYFLKQFPHVPIYATRMSVGIMEGKLAEHGIRDAHIYETHAGSVITAGHFEVEFINVNHSMPDACALCITTPAGRILHTGDFKVDYTPVGEPPIDLARLAELGRKGIKLLLADSTNAEQPGYTPSESSLSVSFDRLFAGESRRIIIATFSSNVHRVQQVFTASEKVGRKVAVTGRSMQNVVAAAAKLGYLDVPDGIMIDISEVRKYPSERVTVLTTGSQGEPMSALYRMAFGEHNHITLGSEDLVILSSSAIPGNEKLITKIINELYKRNTSVITYSNYDIHVSGHACREELKLIQALTRPEYFMPVHGEYKHLIAHANLAKEMGMCPERIIIPENGRIAELSKRSFKAGGSVVAGAVMVDGSGIGDVGGVVLRERKHLSESGIIFLTVGIDPELGYITVPPELMTKGFVYEKQSEELLSDIIEASVKSLEKSFLRNITDISIIKNRLRDDIGDFVRKKTKRRPMVVTEIFEVLE